MNINRLLLSLALIVPLVSAETATNDNYVNFTYPNNSLSSTASTDQTLSSTEYWEVVRGAALKSGVAISFTSNKSVILLSPQATLRQGTKSISPAINSNSIALFTPTGGHELSTTYNSDEMNGYGFFPGSAAVQANQLAGITATLRLTQDMHDEDVYLLHVKESYSPYPLVISSNTVVDENVKLQLSADFAGSKQALNDLNLRVFSPDGELIEHTTVDNELVFAQPLKQIGIREGLHNVIIHSKVQIDGLTIKRSLRVPFVNQVNTASVSHYQLTEQSGLDLGVDVALDIFQSGRYSVSATVLGKVNGVYQTLATSEAAKDFTHSGVLPIHFTLPKRAEGPFQIKLLELKDQTRLQRFVLNTPANH